MWYRGTWEACPIDYTEGLGNIYGNGSQTCRSKGKTYRYAQLEELVNSITVEHVLKHEVICRSKPKRRSTEKVKLLLNNSHLEPQAVRPLCHHGDDGLE
jgi:hypothetical protein